MSTIDSDDDDMPISQLSAKRKRQENPAVAQKLEKVPATANGKAVKKPDTGPKVNGHKPKKPKLADSEESEEDVEDEDEGSEDEEEDESAESNDSQPKPKRRASKPKHRSKKKQTGKKAGKKSGTKAQRTSAVRGNKAAGAKESGARKAAKVKVETKEKEPTSTLSSKAIRLEQAMKAFKWWDEQTLPTGLQWLKLEHNGIFFPPEHIPHGIKMRYDGREVDLPADLEEVATFFASMPPDGPQLGNPDTAKIFTKNFFTEFREMLESRLENDLGIKDFKKCDFEAIRAHLEQKKIIKKAATAEEKKIMKTEKEQRQDFYGYAIVDGRIERVGNYNMEPPGLFRGRGKHPLMGKIKKRCMPERITINVGPDARVPPCALPGHAWEKVQHDNKVTWLAAWKENIMESAKYVMLAASSSFRGKSDKEKYDKAARLKLYIEKIRRDYEHNLVKTDPDTRQLSTALWLIDRLALRVGGEKGEDEADTVGCCSLRREHLTFADSDDVFEIELEFLGKDSMLFKQTIDFASYGAHGVQTFQNLKSFCERKKPAQDVFDRLTPSIVNSHLSSFMPGLSAKVFRTYNASETLQNELPKLVDLEGLNVAERVIAYNEANRKVAILCNHQRTVSKSQETALEALQDRLVMFKGQKRELQQMLVALKQGKTKDIKLREDDVLTEKAQAAAEEAEALRKQANTPEEKVRASQALDAAKDLKRQSAAAKARDAHLWAKAPSKEQVDKQVQRWTEKIKKLEVDIRNKDDNKEVSLGTSKINYMDPRISVAWCKRVEVPIEKIFAKTLRDKFVWSMGVPPDWRFEGIRKAQIKSEE